jgi:hypothetical protein
MLIAETRNLACKIYTQDMHPQGTVIREETTPQEQRTQ